MHRLLYVVANYSAAMDGYSNLTRLQSVVVWWKALIVTCITLFTIVTAASVTLYVLGEIDENRKKKATTAENAEPTVTGGNE